MSSRSGFSLEAHSPCPGQIGGSRNMIQRVVGDALPVLCRKIEKAHPARFHRENGAKRRLRVVRWRDRRHEVLDREPSVGVADDKYVGAVELDARHSVLARFPREKVRNRYVEPDMGDKSQTRRRRGKQSSKRKFARTQTERQAVDLDGELGKIQWMLKNLFQPRHGDGGASDPNCRRRDRPIQIPRRLA